jgi:hypothetical protein
VLAILEKRMTPDQVTKAKARAAAFAVPKAR